MQVFSLSNGGSICFQYLTELSVENCGFLRFMFSSIAYLHLVRLKDLSIKGCVRLKEVIRTTAEFTNNISLPKLNLLELKNLPKLTRFSSGTSVDLSSLTELNIKGCRQLKTFLANSKRTNMVTLSLFDEHVSITCTLCTMSIPIHVTWNWACETHFYKWLSSKAPILTDVKKHLKKKEETKQITLRYSTNL